MAVILLVTMLITVAFSVAVLAYHQRKKKRNPLDIIACILTANDNIINISFSSRNPDYLAKSINQIYAVDDTSGVRLPVLNLPRLGKMANLRKGRKGNYGYIMLANIGHVVTRGSSLTLVIGDRERKRVTVI